MTMEKNIAANIADVNIWDHIRVADAVRMLQAITVEVVAPV